jgi:ubiquinone/menaquinone biosynthesis C-methylase UbiE
MRRIDLGSLGPHPDGQPARILEIGVGAGANLPLIQRDLPPHLEAEIWGIDLSEGMVRQCQAALARASNRPSLSARACEVRLLIADAHALPFPDHTFDRVFHVGAMGSYRDPRTALAEMARVAIPGTPIVVVDEQLDPSQHHNLYRRTAFRLLTFYDRNPHCPRELLPDGATEIIEEQLGRFYYCLTFTIKVPAPPSPSIDLKAADQN